MEQFSPNEVANFVVGLITLILILFVFFRSPSSKVKPFFWGFAFMFCASFFTLAEEFFAENIFNFLEHLFFALAAWAFLLACLRIKRESGDAAS